MQTSTERIFTLYQKGIAAYQSKNWDYAVALFTEVLHLAPEHPSARTNLRLAEFQKFDTHRFKLWYKISKFIPRVKALIYWHKKNWIGVLQELEKPLRTYPKNLRILRRQAQAAENAGLTEIACGIYETIFIVNPADVITLKKLGRLYHELNQPEKARTYYEKALAIAPMDYDARKGVQDLAALGTIAKGWEETGTYRGKILDEKEADLFEKEKRLVRSAEDTLQLIKQLSNEPETIPNIKKLAELYTSIGEFDKALGLYEKITPPDPAIRKEIFNIKMQKLKDKPELQKQLILENIQERVKEFPSYLPLRYEMGTVYMENEMMDKAIGEFQLSVKDPKYRILSLNKLGLCFYKKGIHDLAINQFQKATSELHEWDELKKEIVYNLGAVYEAMGEREKAVAEYKKIYEQDINYRDISQKITAWK